MAGIAPGIAESPQDWRDALAASREPGCKASGAHGNRGRCNRVCQVGLSFSCVVSGRSRALVFWGAERRMAGAPVVGAADGLACSMTRVAAGKADGFAHSRSRAGYLRLLGTRMPGCLEARENEAKIWAGIPPEGVEYMYLLDTSILLVPLRPIFPGHLRRQLFARVRPCDHGWNLHQRTGLRDCRGAGESGIDAKSGMHASYRA